MGAAGANPFGPPSARRNLTMLDLPLRLQRNSDVPVYRQITGQIIEFVRSGRVARGSKLPPTRSLAVACGVHRNTIVAAYAELHAQGYTEAGPGRGTFIARHVPEDDFVRPPLAGSDARDRRFAAGIGGRGFAVSADPKKALAQQPVQSGVRAAGLHRPPAATHRPGARGSVLVRRAPINAGELFSRVARELPGTRDQVSLLGARRADSVNLKSGAIALDLFPWEAFRRAIGHVLGKEWRRLTHGDLPLGLEPLRVALSTFLFSRGVVAEPGEIAVTTGSQQAIDLVARLFLEPGDSVVVEDPGYPAARQRFALEGAEIVSVPVDDRGLIVERLGRLLRRRPVKLVYITPNCQWPTSVRMDDDRRRELAELASRFNFIVVEDDYAAELRFRGPAVAPLFMTMPPGRCINLGSFSKSMLPGLRLGYAVAPPEISRRMASLKMLTDSHSSLLVQATVAEFLAGGHFETHLRRLRRECRLRLEALTRELRQQVGDRLAWNEPDAGSHLWGRLTGNEDAASLAAFSRERGLEFTPGAAYFSNPRMGRSHLLMSFASTPVTRARPTARAFAECLHAFTADVAGAEDAAPGSPRTRPPARIELAESH
jgi:DNA-binding transcriptional MocR family regulator